MAARKSCARRGIAGDDGDLFRGKRLAITLLMSSPVAGVNSDGLIIARLPAAIAVASGVSVNARG